MPVGFIGGRERVSTCQGLPARVVCFRFRVLGRANVQVMRASIGIAQSTPNIHRARATCYSSKVRVKISKPTLIMQLDEYSNLNHERQVVNSGLYSRGGRLVVAGRPL